MSKCPCHRCVYDREDSDVFTTINGISFYTGGMIVCPECGNKRCPKASYHGHDCTGSNEPGQPGSLFTKFTGHPPTT